MRSIISFVLLFIGGAAMAQSGYMDNALNYNRLIRERTGDGVYKVIGNLRVVGTSYLIGEKNKGNLFSPEAKAYNIYLSYNTYNQEVEFYSSANPDKPLVKEPGSVDSFVINDNIEVGINKPIKFVYATHIGASDKFYYQEIVSGGGFSLYKRYKSELDYVSTNYPDLFAGAREGGGELEQLPMLRIDLRQTHLDLRRPLRQLKSHSTCSIHFSKGYASRS